MERYLSKQEYYFLIDDMPKKFINKYFVIMMSFYI